MTNVVTPPSVSPVTGRGASTWVSSATRHLCAGAYLDDDFRDSSLREVYFQPRRMVAPSYGFDLIAVLFHCLRARNALLIRDGIIVGALFVTAAVSASALLMCIAGLLCLYTAVAFARLLRDALRGLRAGRGIDLRTVLLRSIVLGLVGTATVFLWIIALAATVDSIIAQGMSGDMGTVVLGFLGVNVLLLLLVGLSVATRIWLQAQVGTLTPGKAPARPQTSARFDAIHQQERGNAVVYSDYSPFVGAGYVHRQWSFAQRLVTAAPPGSVGRTGEREFRQPPFTTGQLVDHLRTGLNGLATAGTPEEFLPGLTVQDRVFMAGTEVSYLTPHVPADYVAHVIRNPTTPVRHYLVCQVTSWNGELVTTVHVHAALQGRSLFLELATMALPPCDRRYRVIDQVDGTGPKTYVRAIVRGLVDAPATVGRAPINLVRAAIDGASNTATSMGTAVRPGYDYGARTAVRELGAATSFRNHLQSQDITKYAQIIERRVVAGVLDFLEQHGVDTAEFAERSVSILNAGVVNNGSGSVSVSGDAVGVQRNEGGGGAR